MPAVLRNTTSVTKLEAPKTRLSQKKSKKRERDASHSNGSDPRVKEFLTYWQDEYQKRTGSPYVITHGKDGKIIKTLLATFDLAKVKDAALRFFDSKDPWVRENGGFTIGVFASQFNKIVSTKPPQRSQPREMPP